MDEVEKAFQDLESAIVGRTTCDISCTFYSKCPMVKYDKNSGIERCVVATLDYDTKRRLINLFVLGEGGLKDEILQTLFALGRTLNLESNKREQLAYIDIVMKVNKSIYKDIDKGQKAPTDLKVDVSAAVVPRIPASAIKEIVIEDPESDKESLYLSPELESVAIPEKMKRGRPKHKLP